MKQLPTVLCCQSFLRREGQKLKREAEDVRMKREGTERRRGTEEEHDDLLDEGPEIEGRPTCAAWLYSN